MLLIRKYLFCHSCSSERKKKVLFLTEEKFISKIKIDTGVILLSPTFLIVLNNFFGNTFRLYPLMNLQLILSSSSVEFHGSFKMNKIYFSSKYRVVNCRVATLVRYITKG